MAWDDPEIGIKWLGVVGQYYCIVNTEGYKLDEVGLNLNDKD